MTVGKVQQHRKTRRARFPAELYHVRRPAVKESGVNAQPKVQLQGMLEPSSLFDLLINYISIDLSNASVLIALCSQ